MTEKQAKFITIAICILSMVVIIITVMHYLTDLMVRVAVLEAEVEYLKGELKEQNTSELEPIPMQPDRGGDVL